MRVLIACEESQVVCKAFRARGHEAYSCDLEPCSGGHDEWHLQQDVTQLLKIYWDLIIAHPPCTYLANSGVQHLFIRTKDMVTRDFEPTRFGEMLKACDFVKLFQNARCDRICIENPIPHKYAKNNIGQYTQIVQPWMFGHPEKKATCLWLKGLPKLVATNDVRHVMATLTKKEINRIHYMSPGPERSKLRSKTYEGLAKAMAEQWG